MLQLVPSGGCCAFVSLYWGYKIHHLWCTHPSSCPPQWSWRSSSSQLLKCQQSDNIPEGRCWATSWSSKVLALRRWSGHIFCKQSLGPRDSYKAPQWRERWMPLCGAELFFIMSWTVVTFWTVFHHVMNSCSLCFGFAFYYFFLQILRCLQCRTRTLNSLIRMQWTLRCLLPCWHGLPAWWALIYVEQH